MKWIFALNAEAVDSYGDLARVAFASTKRYSTLDAVCLFDEEGEFSGWLEAQGVTVVRVRSRFHDDIQRLTKECSVPHLANAACGTFLRLEIPRVARELGWGDEFVFYTDTDVIFERDPHPLLEPLRPRVFAVTPETFQDRPLYTNTGAMWMNIETFDDPKLEEWTRANLKQCLYFAYDQGALQVFYNPLHRLAWRIGVSNSLFYGVMSRLPLRNWKWSDLPVELNWKPYWGANPDACIIHFHGLKPTQRAALQAGALPEMLSVMHTPFFDECAAKWDEWLKQARAL